MTTLKNMMPKSEHFILIIFSPIPSPVNALKSPVRLRNRNRSSQPDEDVEQK